MAADSAGGAFDRLRTAGTGGGFRRSDSFRNGSTGVRAGSHPADGGRDRSNSCSRNHTDSDPDSASHSDPDAVTDPDPVTDAFADTGLFDGEPIVTEDSYRSSDTAIFLSTVSDKSKAISPYNLVYHIADIYVKDVTSLKSAFAKGEWKYRYTASVSEIAENNNAVLAISGDYIRFRDTGICLRNGELYREKADRTRDIGVIYRDGTMKTFVANEVPPEVLSDPNVWQILGFGPELLDENGKAKTRFNTKVAGINPRALIGYYGPGHFCFILVEGRQYDKKKEKYSAGLTMKELSLLCETLGLRQAFNLDGGATACMYFNGEVVNHNKNYPRAVSDIFYLPFTVYPPEPTETPAAESAEQAPDSETAAETIQPEEPTDGEGTPGTDG